MPSAGRHHAVARTTMGGLPDMKTIKTEHNSRIAV